MKKRILSLFCALALCLGLLPSAAFAAGTDTGKAIQLVDSGTAANIGGGQADNLYFGTYQQSSDGNGGYNIDPIKWRVLENAGGQLFLLSDQNLDVFQYHTDWESVTWEKSTMRSWLNGYGASENTGGDSGTDYTSDNFIGAAFSEKEQKAIAETTVVNDDNGSIEDGNDTTDKIFLLSIAEASNSSYFADDASRISTNTAYVVDGGKIGGDMYSAGKGDWWWLRSPGSGAYYAAGVAGNGDVDSAGVLGDDEDRAVRPAFHLDLNSVLFTSAAAGGKAGDGLNAVADYDGNEWKLTLLDNSRNFSISDAKTNGSGDTIVFSYSDAQTGTNEYISIVIEDNGAITYYGRILQLDGTTNGSSGTTSLTLPDGALGDTTKLYVFNEQYNGGENDNSKLTDYGSELIEVNPTVDDTAPTLSNGSATRDSETSATVKFTSDEAGEYYYTVVESGATEPTDIVSGDSANMASGENTINLTNLTAGAKDIYIVAKDAMGNVSTSLKVEIGHLIDISGARHWVNGPIIYNGMKQWLTVNVEVNGKILSSAQYVSTFKNAKNVGTASYTVKGVENEGYTGELHGTFEIKPAPLTIASAEVSGKTYDGTATVTITGVTLDGVYNYNNDDVSVADTSTLTGTLSSADAGTYYELTLTGTASLTGTGADNYTLTLPSEGMTVTNVNDGSGVTISKAAAVDTNPGAMSVSNNAAQTYTYDLSQLLPALDGGKTLGEVSYALDTVSLGSYYDNSSPATISGSTLTLPIQAVDSSEEKEIGTVAVTISSDNYTNMTGTITVSSVNKQIQSVTISGQPGSVVYGDSFTLTASAPGSGAVTWSASGCASVDSNGKVTITGTGEFTITAAVAEDETYAAASNSVTMTAGKKTLTITADSKSAYVGDSAPALTYAVTGLVGSDTLTTAPTLSYASTPDMSKAGEVQILISGAEAGDNYTIAYAPGTLTITTRPSSGGGSSSSGGGSSNTTTETTKNPDGSTTTTVTSSNGTVTETTKFPDGSKEVVETTKDGTVTTTTTDADGNQTEVVENPDGSTETTVTNKNGSSSTTTVSDTGKVESSVKLPAAVVDSAAETGEAVALPMPEVPVTADKENAPTVTVDLPVGGSVKVEIPVEDVTPGTVAVLVKEDGTEEVVKTSLTTETGVAVTLSDGDTVKIVDNSKTFADVPGNYWGAEAVDFAVSRELFAGTSATTFAPDTAMTRGMIVTVLARFEGVDTTAGDTWYEAGQQWAVANGVSDGTNLDGSLTREQLATMLYRYAQSAGIDTAQGGMAVREYADFEQISDYAVEAMTWAVNTGLISGTSTTTLSPQGEATRAQVATILMRFIETGI